MGTYPRPKRLAMVALLTSVSLSILVMTPRTVAHADSSVSVSNVTQIYSESQRSAKGLGHWPDAEMGVLQSGSSYHWFSANGGTCNTCNSAMTTGSLDDPANSVNYSSKTINGLPANTFGYADVGPVYQDSAGNIISFVHLERWPGGDYGHFWGSIGMAVSKDGGNTWNFCGEIIQHYRAYDPTATTPYEVSNGSYVIVNGYFYVYFTDVTPNTQYGQGVARAAQSDVTAAADAASCSAPTFHKWYNGAWDSAPAAWVNGTGGTPQGGPFQDVTSAPGQFSGNGGEVSITYNSYLGQYLLGLDVNTGLGLRISSNPLDFSSSPSHQIVGDSSTNDQYPTFVGLGSDPETVTGQQFYMYYIQWPANGGPFDSNSTLQRATITVGGTGPASATVNDTDSGIVYSGACGGSGSWAYGPNRNLGDYNNDEHYATANGDSFSYSFSGTGITWVGEKNNGGGADEVYVDNVDKGSVNTYNASRLVQQTLYSIAGLPAGSHTLRIVKTGGSFTEVDALTPTQ